MASNREIDQLYALGSSVAIGVAAGCTFGIGLGVATDSVAYGLFLGLHGAVFGAFLGFFTGPILDFALKRHATVKDVLVIIVFSVLVAFAAGLGGGWLNRPMAAIGATVVFYIVSCAVVGVRSDRRWRRRNDPNLCPTCGYSIIGLQNDTCPECGNTARPASHTSDSAREVP